MFAVWVTGKKPKGSGWELDATLKRDTGKWIEVIGRPGDAAAASSTCGRSRSASPPRRARPPTPRPRRRRRSARSARRWSSSRCRSTARPTWRRTAGSSCSSTRTWTRSTFAGRVLLRYAGPRLPGDRAFDGVKLTYDDGRRALTVDPGDVLRPGRRLELILLPGIIDVDGLPLVPRVPTADAGRRGRGPPLRHRHLSARRRRRITISGSTNSAAGRRHPVWRKRAATSKPPRPASRSWKKRVRSGCCSGCSRKRS